jgi:kynurenine formamidase
MLAAYDPQFRLRDDAGRESVATLHALQPFGTADQYLHRARFTAIRTLDSHNIDRTDGGERPVHSALLRADIPIFYII